MVEILLLIYLTRKLKAVALSKNRNPGWAALAVVGWVGGELSGLFLAAGSGDAALMYACALFGAAVGAFIAYRVVAALSTLPADPDFPTARVV